MTSLRGKVGGRRGRRFFGLPWFAQFSVGFIRLTGPGTRRLRLAGVIVAGGAGINGGFSFRFDLVEHLALRRVRLGAAAEHFAPAHIELFKQRLIFKCQCHHELFQLIDIVR